MFRDLARLIVVIVVVVAAVAFFTGYRWGRGPAATREPVPRPAAVGTSGGYESSRERARATGAEIGEAVAVGAQKAGETLDEAGTTAKVKSKIALDDTLKGSRIHVATDDGRVTLTGTVLNQTQHARALALARETDSAGSVVDHLSVGTR